MAHIKIGYAPTRRSIFSAPDAVKYRGLTADRLRELGIDFVDIDDINDEGLLYNDEDRIKIAEKFVRGMRKLSNSYIDNKTKFSMQFLADIMKIMSLQNLITKKDLYELSEKEVIEKIENCDYAKISQKFDMWKNAHEIKESDEKVKDKYCVSIDAKIRYINPLVNGIRISEISEVAKEEIQKALEFKTKKYAYLNFDNI